MKKKKNGNGKQGRPKTYTQEEVDAILEDTWDKGVAEGKMIAFDKLKRAMDFVSESLGD